MIKKILNYISNHFLLRNIVMAICLVLVFLFFVTIVMNFMTRHGQRIIVPDFAGKTVSEVKNIANEMDINVEVIDSLYIPKEIAGAVLDQSPNAGMGVKKGRKIFLVINAEKPRMEIIPYVSGYSLRQAKNILENKGFEIAKLVYKEDLATNNVLGESYKGTPIMSGSSIKAELGSGVVLTVGRNSGSPLPLVPKVIGLNLREAKSRIWEMGLNVGEVKVDGTLKGNDLDQAKVYRQTPNQQMRSGYGSPVTLYVTSDIEKIKSGSKESDVQARNFVEVDSTEIYDLTLE